MNENQISLLIYSLIYILLIALSFLFSMCDMAYGSVNVNHIKVNCEKNKKKSLKISLKLLDNFDQTLSTIILSNDLVNIALEIISIPFSFSLLKVIGIDSSSSLFTIVTLVISIATLVILILFGDILPKSIGKIQNYKVVTSSSIFIFILYYALFPFTFLTKHSLLGQLRVFVPFSEVLIKVLAPQIGQVSGITNVPFFSVTLSIVGIILLAL